MPKIKWYLPGWRRTSCHSAPNPNPSNPKVLAEIHLHNIWQRRNFLAERIGIVWRVFVQLRPKPGNHKKHGGGWAAWLKTAR